MYESVFKLTKTDVTADGILQKIEAQVLCKPVRCMNFYRYLIPNVYVAYKLASNIWSSGAQSKPSEQIYFPDAVEQKENALVTAWRCYYREFCFHL